MDDIKEKIKQALRHIWINKYRLFFCLLTLCCLFGLVHYFKSADSATASISFNYSEAALGMNPNKTRFNAYEIVSDEVMERAIRRVGLQDSLTASQLAQCLYLSPEGTGSANGSEYISTNYYLSINTRKLELGSRKATDLLQSVCESYREIFQSSYCDNQSLLKEKLEVTTDCEPYLRLNELEVRAEGLNRYLNTRLQENKSFTDDANPDSSTNNFTTMGKKINNLVDYDLPNAMAFVIEGGVARDPSMLTSILEYKNKIDDIAMRKKQAYYDADKKGISIYEKSMTSIMMIPTVDEDSEYYMSRTKTAMDALARAADSALSDATGYQTEIVSTNYVNQKIRELDAGQPRLAEAQAMVNAKAVILTSGGFGANMDMVVEYKPELKGFMTTNAPGILGQGIKMAQAIGADTVDMDQIQIHPTVEANTAALITEGLRGDGAVLINAEGKRFIDEVGTRDVVSAAEIAQTGSYSWLVVDQAMVDASSVIQGYIKKGYTVTGETYEELGKAMGVDEAAFAETMNTWNGYVEAKNDPDFGRTSFANKLDTAPYYAIKVTAGVHHTMGGLKINTNTEVLNENGEVIPGLFAAGEVTGGVHGANRLGGNAVADFTVFGRIAGAAASKYAA